MKLRSSKKQVRFDPIIHAVYIRGGVTTRQVTQLQEQAKPRREPHREPQAMACSPSLESAMLPLHLPAPSEDRLPTQKGVPVTE